MPRPLEEWTPPPGRTVDALVLDVDGVLTDGVLLYGPEGVGVRFHVRDGSGIARARAAGLAVGWLSGRDVPAVRRRAEELGIDELALGVRAKDRELEAMARRLDTTLERIAYVGDDLIDLPALERAGLGIGVADAHPDVLARVSWVTRARGGHGAVREVVDHLLAVCPPRRGEG